jgi:hypothetical protein
MIIFILPIHHIVDAKGVKEIEKKEEKKKTDIKTEVKVPNLEANTKKPKK